MILHHGRSEVCCPRLPCSVRRYKHGNQSKSRYATIIISLHRSTMWVDGAYCKRPSSVWFVDLSVGLSPSEPCKNFWSDWDNVCAEDSVGPRETPITVCTVVQDCCKGRSNKYRKWHFWGSCRPETPQPINMKFGMYHSTPQIACQSDKGRDPHEWVKC